MAFPLPPGAPASKPKAAALPAIPPAPDDTGGDTGGCVCPACGAKLKIESDEADKGGGDLGLPPMDEEMPA